jgi:MFS family permease
MNASTAHRRPSLAYAWLIVAVLMILFTSSFIDRQILALMVKPIRADLAISDTGYSFLAGFSFAILYSIAGIPMGYVVDRWSRTHLIVIGVTVWSLMTAACGLASTYWQLFAARVGVGVGEATLSPASYSLVSDLFPPRQLSRALSVYGIGIPMGSGLALVIGGPLVQYLTELGTVEAPLLGVIKPWQAVFYAVGLPGLLLAVLTLWIVREPERHEAPGTSDGTQPSLRAIFAYLAEHRSVFAPIFLGLAPVAIVWYGGAAWYPTYLQRVQDFSVAEAGLFLGISAMVFGVIGTVLAGVLADRFIGNGRADGHFIVGIIFSLGALVCGGLAPLVPVQWLTLTLISLNAIFAFTWVGVNAAVLQIVTPNRMRGQVSALYLFTTNAIGQGLGATSVAVATDYVFKDDQAVGGSIALVSFISVAIGCAVMQLGRKPLARLVVARHA